MYNEIYENIEKLLFSRNWNVVKENETFKFLKPPNDLSIESEWSLRVPKKFEAPDIKEYTEKIIKVISDIYEDIYDYEDLKRMVFSHGTIFSLRIEDDDTNKGSISFNKFEELLDQLKNLFLHTASFVMTKEPILKDIPSEAEKYLNLCKFLRTEKGSFVAKVELPSKEVLKEQSFFSEQLDSEIINERLYSFLDFVRKDVFYEINWENSDTYFENHRELINIDVLTDIHNLFEKTEISNINFEFLNVNYVKKIATNEITLNNTDQLKDFINVAKDKIISPFETTINGYIYQLKSNNPDRDNNNIIRVSCIIDNIEADLSLTNVPHDIYQTAINAHKDKKQVLIKGIVRKDKTQYTVLHLNNFKVIEK